jgi:hypothetical protein
MSSYFKEFLWAMARNKRFNLPTPFPWFETGRRWLDAKAKDEFAYILHDELDSLDFKEVSKQCLSLHYRLAPIVSHWLNCEVFYTVGWVDFGAGGNRFYCDDASLNEILRRNHNGETVKLHAWLTLPSMEIIDATLATTLAISHNSPEMLFTAIANHADALKGMSYKPMLIGEEFLRRSGLIPQPAP